MKVVDIFFVHVCRNHLLNCEWLLCRSSCLCYALFFLALFGVNNTPFFFTKAPARSFPLYSTFRVSSLSQLAERNQQELSMGFSNTDWSFLKAVSRCCRLQRAGLYILSSVFLIIIICGLLPSLKGRGRKKKGGGGGGERISRNNALWGRAFC